ncbi:M20/M25/M40 family metallo-hydrolase [Breznakiella homolactica]|uniref:M20/M25/M40 family metallo-hydrolase n=1 Tax=Breznakiella homolactica TaxID=2798577 RepID=A0A7T7XMF6_9SPIR|nr:M20/M25/M40 family metallo-hydrolase [Breznakiella homolactica]QQO08917.1 M20/M25/M40 family metallo-hydrolase [Breznakiella homolactica]
MKYPIPSELLSYVEDSHERLLGLIRELCRITAPSLHEERRADFCRKWLEDRGAAGVYTDAAKNTVFPVNIENKNSITVIMAHTDTVFPDTEPMPFIEKDGRFHSPGVGDDTANLAVLLMLAAFVAEKRPAVPGGMLFVANSAEEGMGNLLGCRHLMEQYKGRIGEVISLDATQFKYIHHDAVGSHRYRVAVKTEGGHSFGNFGNRNAIAYLASLIQTLYQIKVPDIGTTTYNVGTISGGTSVNTIAQHAEMLYEYRSDSREALEIMKRFFYSAVDTYRNMGIGIEAELVGERPCSDIRDHESQNRLVEKCRDIYAEYAGIIPSLEAGSTDCNIPLSLGIPAVTIGVCRGGGIHTREEWLETESLKTGFKLAAAVTASYFTQ